MAATQTIRSAISKVEAAYPGFTYDMVVGIMRRGDISINMNESVLRLQGPVSDADGQSNINNRSRLNFCLAFSCREPSNAVGGRIPRTKQKVRSPQAHPQQNTRRNNG